MVLRGDDRWNALRFAGRFPPSWGATETQILTSSSCRARPLSPRETGRDGSREARPDRSRVRRQRVGDKGMRGRFRRRGVGKKPKRLLIPRSKPSGPWLHRVASKRACSRRNPKADVSDVGGPWQVRLGSCRHGALLAACPSRANAKRTPGDSPLREERVVEGGRGCDARGCARTLLSRCRNRWATRVQRSPSPERIRPKGRRGSR